MRDGGGGCWESEQNGFGAGSRIKIRRWEVEDDEDGGGGDGSDARLGDPVSRVDEVRVLIVVGGIS